MPTPKIIEAIPNDAVVREVAALAVYLSQELSEDHSILILGPTSIAIHDCTACVQAPDVPVGAVIIEYKIDRFEYQINKFKTALQAVNKTISVLDPSAFPNIALFVVE